VPQETVKLSAHDESWAGSNGDDELAIFKPVGAELGVDVGVHTSHRDWACAAHSRAFGGWDVESTDAARAELTPRPYHFLFKIPKKNLRYFRDSEYINTSSFSTTYPAKKAENQGRAFVGV
jgi:hypothetical protein